MQKDVALQGNEHIHLIGIGGAGMSAIARVLLERGHPVSGSDLRDSPTLRDLAGRGARVHVGHAPEHLGAAEIVVVTSAAPPDNPEVLAARERGLALWPRAAMLRALTRGRRCLAVAGTHGKTTTTAMIVLLLRAGGLDPSFIIGGDVAELGGNGHAGRGPHFVLEADEYDRTFLALEPAVAVVTNVEWDHVDCYPDPVAVREAFAQFLAQVPSEGAVYLCRDDAGAWGLPRPAAVVHGYGLDPQAEWRAAEVRLSPDGTRFLALREGRPPLSMRLLLPGEHNVRNALAALAVAAGEGLDLEQVGPALAAFGGVERRFQCRGEAGGVVVVDDYAHHPGEIRATLAGARQRFPDRRLVVAFQPHTYSRTRAFAADFARALSAADQVLVTGIYAARELDPGDISGADLAARVRPPATYAATLDEARDWLLEHLRPGDVLLTLGAGDVTLLGPQVLAGIRKGRTTDGR